MQAKGKILIVDDEISIIELVQMELVRRGYHVRIASGGEEALSILRENEMDLLVTDLRMPNIDGVELIRRANQINPKMPCVIVSGQGELEVSYRGKDIHIYRFLEKPFGLDEIEEILENALQQLDR